MAKIFGYKIEYDNDNGTNVIYTGDKKDYIGYPDIPYGADRQKRWWQGVKSGYHFQKQKLEKQKDKLYKSINSENYSEVMGKISNLEKQIQDVEILMYKWSKVKF
jgi:hypothetical protein